MSRQLQMTIGLLILCASEFSVAEEANVQKLKMFCSMGKELDVLNGYQEAELLHHEGRGCLTHMWFGGNWPGYERTRIRIYVDGEEIPSIDMELGLGHGVGFADSDAPWGCRHVGQTGHPSGLYNNYRIPFGKRIRVTGTWKDLSFLEACMRAYVDGANEPVLLSSGLEDYFLGTYYFNRGKYANDVAGLTHLDKEKASFSAFRFHDEDPIFFDTGLRLTCRCGEELAGRVFHEPSDTTYSTYTWVYQW